MLILLVLLCKKVPTKPARLDFKVHFYLPNNVDWFFKRSKILKMFVIWVYKNQAYDIQHRPPNPQIFLNRSVIKRHRQKLLMQNMKTGDKSFYRMKLQTIDPLFWVWILTTGKMTKFQSLGPSNHNRETLEPLLQSLPWPKMTELNLHNLPLA